jgi:hypothetical protein
MDPATAERLSQINQAIQNVENAKREQQQTLAAFFEHVPAADQEQVKQRIQQLLNGIRTLEERRRTLIREQEFLIVGAASSIRGEQGGNN